MGSIQSVKGVLAATTAGTSQTIDGFGFTPKAAIFWTAAMQDAEGFTNHQSVMLGVAAVGHTSREVYAGWLSGATAPNGTIYTPGHSGITLGIADGLSVIGVVTLEADGFSIEWASTPSVAGLVHYLVVGGDGIEDAAVVLTEFFGTGAQSIGGLSFQPDCGIFLGSGTYSASAYGVSMGAAVSASKQWAWAVNSVGGAATPEANWSKSMQRTDRCLLGITDSGADVEMEFSTFTSDGCEFNVPANPSGFPFVALLLRTGGRVDLGAFDKTTQVGVLPGIGSPQNVVDPDFTGEVVAGLLCSVGRTSSSSLWPDSKISIGAFQGNEIGGAQGGHIWSGSLDQNLPSQANSLFVDGAVLSIADVTTTLAQALAVPWENGTILIGWSPNTPEPSEILWLAFATEGGRTIDAVVESKKPFVAAQAHNFRSTAAVTLKKSAVSIAAAVPVLPVDIAATVVLKKSEVLAGAFIEYSPTGTAGEGMFGEIVFGPPDHIGVIAVTLKKPTASGTIAQMLQGIAVTLKKSTVAITAVETFVAAAAVTLKKPTASLSGVQALIEGSIAVTLKKATAAIAAQERFVASAAVTLKKATAAIQAQQGTVRIGVTLKKSTVSVSGTVTLSHYFLTGAVTLKKSTAAGIGLNIPPLHLLPRARQSSAVR